MQEYSFKKNYKLVFIALLCGIAIFSIVKYVRIAREKHELQRLLEEAKTEVVALSEQKQNLSRVLEKEKEAKEQLGEINLALKKGLKVSVRRIKTLGGDLSNAKIEATQLHSQLSSLQGENAALKEKKDALAQEKDNLQAKLNSVTELRKAIRELKRQAGKIGAELLEKGRNQGFIIKDGKSTYPAKGVKIDVLPATSTHPENK